MVNPQEKVTTCQFTILMEIFGKKELLFTFWCAVGIIE